MSATIRNNLLPQVSPSILDRAIAYVSPESGRKRMQARVSTAMATNFLTGGYDGAATDRRETSSWNPFATDADSSTLIGMTDMRARSRDANRNHPIATGAINSTVSAVIGAGLVLQSTIDRQLLNMDDEPAEQWQRNTEREWKLFSEAKECDWSREMPLNGLGELAFRSTLENGDCFALLPRKKRGFNPYSLCIQLVEADRVCNPNYLPDSKTMVAGIEKDAETGEPIAYHILQGHPGNVLYMDKSSLVWKRIPAYDAKTGLPNVIHLKRQLRIGQSRGIPFLAPVIEMLKMVSRYSQAELMAAVVSAMFTVFVKTPAGTGLGGMSPVGNGIVTSNTPAVSDGLKLGNGMIVDLAAGEEIQTADPNRPNAAFDPFFLAIVRQIGMALEIPYEVLIQHFTASYSAARMAVEQAWVFYLGRRAWMAETFYKPIYEAFLTESIALGRTPAAGFFSSPLMRQAYLCSTWTGPKKPQVDPVKEVEAAKRRVEEEFSTRAIESATLTGTDWDTNHIQRAREEKSRREDQTNMQVVAVTPVEPVQNQDQPEVS